MTDSRIYPVLDLAPTEMTVGFCKCPQCGARLAIGMEEFEGEQAITCASCGWSGRYDLRFQVCGP